MEGNINQDDNLITLQNVYSTLILKIERLNVSNEDDVYGKNINEALVTSQFKGSCNNCGKCRHKKQYFRINGNNNKSNDNTGKKSF